jgi:Gas vesicle synthesis protein GvpL/GvpF
VERLLAADDLMSRATTAVYLYCVVGAAKRPSVARVPGGVPGSGRAAVHPWAPGLWIVTADVPLAIYDPAHLEPRLRDLDWVAKAALAHEALVEHFSRLKGSTVIPAKLFTMFSSMEKAIADVAARREAIRRALRRIAGADEWGVRVFRQTTPPAAVTLPAPSPSGADFLRARKQARDAHAAARLVAAEAAGVAFDRLRQHARDAHVRDARREPGSNPPILDAAFLVPGAARARFKAEARRQAAALARAGADLVVTGPWPAYNFVDAGESA